MSNPKKESIEASKLELGMYVSELDRPWLETPFYIQGFLIETHEQIVTIQKLCKIVVIDRTLSINEHFMPEKGKDVAFTREGSVIKLKSPNQNTQQNQIEFSNDLTFYDIVKEILSERKNEGSLTKPLSKIKRAQPETSNIYNLRVEQEKSRPGYSKKSDIPADNPPSFTSQVKSDVGSLFSFLKGWVGKTDESSYSDPKSPRYKPEQNNSNKKNEEYRITIYEENVSVEQEIIRISNVFDQTQVATKKLFEALADKKHIDLTQINESIDSMLSSIERNSDALLWLSKLKQTDDYAFNHAINVSINLMALGQYMSLPKYQLKELGIAGLLQDVGKLKIPKEILFKKGELSSEELDVVKSHVENGLDMLHKTNAVSPAVLYTIEQHHERINGQGYPKGLKGNAISLHGQMAGLIDTYCAITADKAYGEGFDNQKALEYINTLRDKEFSSALVDNLIQFLGIYPVSSLVELNTGEVGVVIQQNHIRRLLPKVMVLLAQDKSRNLHPHTIDLITSPKTPSGFPYQIKYGIPPNSYGLNPSDFYL